MVFETKNNDELHVKLDVSKLEPAQIRLIKSIISMLHHVATVNEESPFFDGSAELMRMVASLVQQSNFCIDHTNDNIPYASQAVEFSMEVIQEAIEKKKVVVWDN